MKPTLEDDMTLSYARGMTGRSTKPITVTLGEMAPRAEARVRDGSYASVSEVMRAGLRALDREDAALDAILKARIEEALADPRPPVSLDAAFGIVRQHAATRRAAVDG